LRSYRDGGEHYEGQIGSETTPAEYVAELVGMIDSEWRRVLKPSGSLFLNMGDKYAGSDGASHHGTGNSTLNIGPHPENTKTVRTQGSGRARVFDARPKSLLGLPWRVALALIDRGWILRAEIIWSKPNGLPESVTDRVRRSHEQVFHFVTEPRYYSAVDEIRDAYAPASLRRYENPTPPITGEHPSAVNRGQDGDLDGWSGNPLGRLPGSVWTIPTSPLIIPDPVREHHALTDHFAAYPPELVRRIILGWSPAKVCERCGEGRRPVSTAAPVEAKSFAAKQQADAGRGWGQGDPSTRTLGTFAAERDRRIVGEACACPTPTAPTTPGVVCDPMCGTGTTIGVAHKLGRDAIGVDLSADYCRLARWRVGDSGHFDGVDDRTAAEAQGVLL
jgi:DNA modification methylase